jgi:hypothetical protein
MSRDEDARRHKLASHAMQAGVALDHARGCQDGTPKQLRVGVNVALRDHASLVELLIAKGVITDDEYCKAIADGMEREVEAYEDRLNLPRGSLRGWSIGG